MNPPTKVPKPVIYGAIFTAIVLTLFAIQLEANHSRATEGLLDRFHDRATTNAALTGALFGSTTTSTAADLSEDFGAGLTSRDLDQRVEAGSNRYALVVDERGGMVAASKGTPAQRLNGAGPIPKYIDAALNGQGYGVSNVLNFGFNQANLELAVGYDAVDGKRHALISGLDPVLINAFFAGFLGETPREEGAEVFITDGNGLVIAGTAGDPGPAEPLGAEGPADLAEAATDGEFGSDQRYSTAQVDGTPWLVVITAPASELLSTVRGSNRWIPWAIFVAFALAALTALAMFRRALFNAAALNSANADLERANTGLETQARELQRSNEDLEQFASIASHDLSEPLRKVSMFAEQILEMERDNLSERGVDFLGRMTAATTRMTTLIQDLLEFSRLSTRGRSFVAIRLSELVEEVIGDLEAPIAESGARIEIGELPEIIGDRSQLRQLFQNLISNAIKFRREGVSPEVKITGRREASQFMIAVDDNGIGFDPRYAQRIFRVFERLHGASVYAGTGIGLALCRKIAERHGGTVIAAGTEGEGATFTVVLPVDPIGPEPEPQQ